MTQTLPLLEATDLVCGYGARQVLEGVGFAVMPGEVVALLGPNGSGKSTLLKTLACTLKPLGGRVSVEGKPLSSLGFAELAQRVAYVPQEEDVRFPFSAYEIVAMGRLARSGSLFDTPDDRAKSLEAMEQTDSAHLADRPITELSGGERQRVLVARALAQGARTLLMDEPTSHLDVRHAVDFARLLNRLASTGYGVIAAVHDLSLAARIAPRGMLLGNGRVVADAPMENLLHSGSLDEVYGVKFMRLKGAHGTLLEAC